MKRVEFCALTGFHPERLKSLQRRGLLPFVLPSSGSKWARLEYSAFRAALLVAFEELTADGMSAELAANLMLEHSRQIQSGPTFRTLSSGSRGLASVMPTSETQKDVWLGFAGRTDQEELIFVYGNLRNVVADLTSCMLSLHLADENFGRLHLVNFTQAFRTVRQRAMHLKIDLSESTTMD
jgi:hypothetical protein